MVALDGGNMTMRPSHGGAAGLRAPISKTLLVEQSAGLPDIGAPAPFHPGK
jgi:hypothetical protein